MDFFPCNFMLSSTPTNDHDFSSHPPPPLTPQDFHGTAPMLGKRSMPYSTIDMWEETNGNHHNNTTTNNNNHNHNHNYNHNDDLLSEDEGGSQLGGGGGIGEKKRRLNMEQVKTLEKNFELGNKLESERKLELAKALDLQPRQIAIWFQNRRARWKTKQLERDYDLLKRQFDSLKAHNDSLLAHNRKLQAQIKALKNREPAESINLNKDIEGSCSNRSSDNSSDHEIRLDISRSTLTTTTATVTESSLGRLIIPQVATTTTTGRALFPSSTIGQQNGPPVAQLLFRSPVQHPQSSVKEETLTNMFCGIDDQNGFWPWIEQSNFN